MSEGTPDTSVVVAGLSNWHPDHDRARAVLATRPQAVAHVLIESYSVLTRLPAPRRIDARLALAALESAFPGMPLVLPAKRFLPLLRQLAQAGIHGGAAYDGLVAETARLAGLALFTLDARARSTYAAVGVETRWIG